MTVLPLSYAGGQQPAYNLTLMPGLVKNHDHGDRLSHSPFMAEIENIMAGDDVMVPWSTAIWPVVSALTKAASPSRKMWQGVDPRGGQVV